MPELPEVETMCNDIYQSPIMGQRIVEASVLWQKSIGMMDDKDFSDRLAGKMFTKVTRRGKYMLLWINDGQCLLVHLRMSGSLVVRVRKPTCDIHDRVIIHGATHELAFHDPRKFGRMILTYHPENIIDTLGVEPLDGNLTAQQFHTILHKRRARIKSVLLDQKAIAGIGNIYADESLFEARIHPCSIASSLTVNDSKRLLDSIRLVLSQAIKYRGTSLGDGESNFISDGHIGSNQKNLKVFQQTGQPCPICHNPIERMVVCQRSTHFCATCQHR